MIWKRLLIIAVLLIGAANAQASARDDGPRFGPEFTFLYPMPEAVSEPPPDVFAQVQAFKAHVDSHLITNQPEGEKFTRLAAQFTSPRDWWFDVVKDSGGPGLEIRMSPLTVREFERYSADIEDAIFASARNLNMWPQLFRGGGHINIDLNYFLTKPILLRNFLVDLVNHSELALGIMSYDTNNAVPIPLSEALFENFKGRISEFDKRLGDAKLNLSEKQLLIGELLATLDRGFFFSQHLFAEQWDRITEPRTGKYTAVSFAHSSAKGSDAQYARIEIRSVRPQWNMDQWIRQIKLFRDRLQYLKSNYGDELLPIEVKVPIQFVSPKVNQLLPPVKAVDALRAFYNFVNESGHRWQDHRDYLWPAWTWPQEGENKSELARFEESAWFKKRESKRCATILKAPQ
jgi:hypothetical protein